MTKKGRPNLSANPDGMDGYREIIRRVRMGTGPDGGVLYIIHAEKTDFYKFGKTKGDPAARRSQLQPGNHRRLHVLAEFATPNVTWLERAVHAELRQYRGEGEWFELPGDILHQFEQDRLPGLVAESKGAKA